MNHRVLWKSLSVYILTRFEIGNVSGQYCIIKIILINDSISETTAGKIKNIVVNFGQ